MAKTLTSIPSPPISSTSSPCPVATSHPLPSIEATVDWFGHVSASIFPWPFIVIMVFLILARSPFAANRIGRLLQRVGLKKIDVAGTGIELSEQKRAEITLEAQEVLDVLGEYGRQLNRELLRLAWQHQISDRVGNYVKRIFTDRKLSSTFRCTVFIEDPLLKGYLNQLIDYIYPMQASTAGRRFSIRYGIIGQSWRTDKAYLVGKWLSDSKLTVPKDPAHPELVDQDALRRYMADNWGMTMNEARRAVRKPSYIALPILHPADKTKLGLLFMDDEGQDAFGTTGNDELLKLYTNELDASGLADALKLVRDDIMKYASLLDLERLADA